MGLKERRKKIMALMLAACVAGTSVVPVAASDVSVFSDGTDTSPEAFDSADVDSANVAAQKTDCNRRRFFHGHFQSNRYHHCKP